MSAMLAWMVLAASTWVALTIMAFLPAIRRLWAALIIAETKKGAVLVESLHGMRTVKALALEADRCRVTGLGAHEVSMRFIPFSDWFDEGDRVPVDGR